MTVSVARTVVKVTIVVMQLFTKTSLRPRTIAIGISKTRLSHCLCLTFQVNETLPRPKTPTQSITRLIACSLIQLSLNREKAQSSQLYNRISNELNQAGQSLVQQRRKEIIGGPRSRTSQPSSPMAKNSSNNSIQVSQTSLQNQQRKQASK